MKSTKVIVSVVFVIMFLMSVLYMVKERLALRNEYEDYLVKAKEYEEIDLVYDAEQQYYKAIEMNPDLELYMELGQFYLRHNRNWDAVTLYEDRIQPEYPKRVEGYLLAQEAALKTNDIEEAFNIYKECKNHCSEYDAATEMMKPYWFAFDLGDSYDEVRPFSGSSRRAAVREDDRWGFAGTDGTAIECRYERVGNYTNLTAMLTVDGEAYCIGKDGKKKVTEQALLKSDPDFGKVERFESASGGFLLAYNGEIWNYYDEDSLKLRFGGYKEATPFGNGVAAVSQDGETWALLSSDGTLLTDFIYQEVLADDKGIVCRTNAIFVKQDDRYWMVDKTGQKIVDEPFMAVDPFREASLAAVERGKGWCFVDETGQFTELGDFDEAQSFAQGCAAVKKGDRWGYIGQDGSVLIDFQFLDAQEMSRYGTTFVKTEGSTSWHLLRLYRLN